MSKGTASHGMKSGKVNKSYCRRCGRRTMHQQKKVCASCGFGATPTMRTYSWNKKK